MVQGQFFERKQLCIVQHFLQVEVPLFEPFFPRVSDESLTFVLRSLDDVAPIVLPPDVDEAPDIAERCSSLR